LNKVGHTPFRDDGPVLARKGIQGPWEKLSHTPWVVKKSGGDKKKKKNG